MAKNRDDFTQRTKQKLCDRVGGLCSKSDCLRPTKGPSSDPEGTMNVGVAAHIESASPEDGPRPNPSLSKEERKSLSNGIWLCQTHSKLIDTDEDYYTVELLQAWKRRAEDRAEQALREEVPIDSIKSDQLDIFPPETYDAAHRCELIGGDDWSRVVGWLGDDPKDHRKNLRRLSSDQPSWVTSLGVDGRHFLALLAHAHHQGAPAGEHLGAAAELSANHSDLFLTERAAIGGESPPDIVSEAFRTSQLWRAVSAAAVDDDSALVEMAMTEDLDLLGPGSKTVAGLYLNALTANEKHARALELLESVLARWPHSHRFVIVKASVLSYQAVHGESYDSAADSAMALELAQQTITEVREWGGPSADAVMVAINAALQLRDYETAESLVADESAPERERSNVDLQRYGVQFGLFPVDADLASPELEALNRAFYAISDGEPDVATENALLAAVGSEKSDETLVLAQSILASLGYLEIPRLDELEHDQQRLVIKAQAFIAAGMPKDAIALLRPIKRFRAAASLLCDAYMADGDVEAAISEAAIHAGKFSGPGFTLQQARYLEQDERPQDALNLLTTHLANSHPAVRRPLRQAQLRLLWSLGRFQDVAASLEAERHAGGMLTLGWRWKLVDAYLQLTKFAPAVKEILSEPRLMPEHREQAKRVIAILLHAASAASVDHAIAIAEHFYPDEDVVGTALNHLTMNPTAKRWLVDDLKLRHDALAGAFHEQYPRSGHLQLFRGDPDDPQSLLDEIVRVQGEPDLAAIRSRRQSELAWQSGSLPNGFIADVSALSYLEIVLSSDYLRWRAGADPAQHQKRVAIASAALDGPVVWDPSVIALATRLPAVETISAQAFQSSSMPLAVLARLDLEQSSPIFECAFDDDDEYSSELTEQLHQNRLESRKAMLQVARNLEGEEVSPQMLASLLHMIDDSDTEATGDKEWWWLTPLALAHSRGIPFYSSDRSVTLLSEQLGIPTFDFPAVLDALHTAGRISDDETSQTFDDLFALGYHPLPLAPTSAQLVDQALATKYPAQFLSWIASDPAFIASVNLPEIFADERLDTTATLSIAVAAGTGLAYIQRAAAVPLAALAYSRTLSPAQMAGAINQLQDAYDLADRQKPAFLEVVDFLRSTPVDDQAVLIQWISNLCSELEAGQRHEVTRQLLGQD